MVEKDTYTSIRAGWLGRFAIGVAVVLGVLYY